MPVKSAGGVLACICVGQTGFSRLVLGEVCLSGKQVCLLFLVRQASAIRESTAQFELVPKALFQQVSDCRSRAPRLDDSRMDADDSFREVGGSHRPFPIIDSRLHVGCRDTSSFRFAFAVMSMFAGWVHFCTSLSRSYVGAVLSAEHATLDQGFPDVVFGTSPDRIQVRILVRRADGLAPVAQSRDM